MNSPLKPLFAAVNRRGLCALDFGRRESDFLNGLDPRARLEKNPKAVQHVMAQLREYFAGGYLAAYTIPATCPRSDLSHCSRPGMDLPPRRGKAGKTSLKPAGRSGIGQQPGADCHSLPPRHRQQRQLGRIQRRIWTEGQTVAPST